MRVTSLPRLLRAKNISRHGASQGPHWKPVLAWPVLSTVPSPLPDPRSPVGLFTSGQKFFPALRLGALVEALWVLSPQLALHFCWNPIPLFCHCWCPHYCYIWSFNAREWVLYEQSQVFLLFSSSSTPTVKSFLLCLLYLLPYHFLFFLCFVCVCVLEID